MKKHNTNELNAYELQSINGGNWIEQYIQGIIEDMKDRMREAGVIE